MSTDNIEHDSAYTGGYKEPEKAFDAGGPPNVTKRKAIRSAKELIDTTAPKLRKHLLTTVYKKEVTEKLDKLHAAGHTVLSITPSNEIRGFEIISYTEE